MSYLRQCCASTEGASHRSDCRFSKTLVESQHPSVNGPPESPPPPHKFVPSDQTMLQAPGEPPYIMCGFHYGPNDTLVCGMQDIEAIHQFRLADPPESQSAAEFNTKAAFLERFCELRDGDNYESAVEVFDVFLEAMRTFAERNRKYEDLWRRAGWLMMLMHTRHKSDRLMQVFWGKENKEGDLDDGFDLMLYTVFFIIGHRQGDSRGQW